MRLLSRAAHLTRTTGSTFTLAVALGSLGSALAGRGYGADARRAWYRAGDMFAAIGNGPARARVIAQASGLR